MQKKGYELNMKVSFIGGGKLLEACYRLFKSKPSFTINGFYSRPIELCADVAIEANGKLFGSMDDLYTDSDIIVIATPDRTVPAIMHKLAMLHTHGKILITVSSKLTSKELTVAYPNTVAIINTLLPLTYLDEKSMNSIPIVCEVSGDDAESFCNLLENSDFKVRFVNEKQLQMFRTSLHLAKYGITASVLCASKLMKISGISSDMRIFAPVINEMLHSVSRNDDILPGTPYSDAGLNEIRKHMDILSENSLDDVCEIYSSIATLLSGYSCDDTEAVDEVFRLAKKHKSK